MGLQEQCGLLTSICCRQAAHAEFLGTPAAFVLIAYDTCAAISRVDCGEEVGLVHLWSDCVRQWCIAQESAVPTVPPCKGDQVVQAVWSLVAEKSPVVEWVY